MHPRHDIPPALRRLADYQSGVVSREQTLGHATSDKVVARLVSSGSWQRLDRSLYLTHPLEPSWDALAWGGILLGGPRSRLGPESSGHLSGLVPVAPAPVDVLVPADKLVKARDQWRFLRERPGVRSPSSFGSPPRLSVEDTVLDLAETRPATEIVGLVTRAVGSRLTTTARLSRQLDRRARHRHRRLLRDLMADVAAGAESPLEVRFVRDVERPHGLPRGERQSSRTGLRYLCDVRYRRFALLVELDGKLNHDGEGRFRDMDRDNRHALLDELTLRFGWYDVTNRPCGVAYQVFTVLSRRGYDLPFRRCAGCARVPELELLSA